MEKNYWVIHMGEANKFADYSYKNNLVAVGWNEINQDLSEYWKLNKKEFFKESLPIISKTYPNQNPKAHSMIAGKLFRFYDLMQIGDIVVVPNTQEGKIYIGSIEGSYFFQSEIIDEFNYQHRRKISWLKIIEITNTSQEFRNSMNAMMTVFGINKYSTEIESLLTKNLPTENIENLEAFGLESQLEDFIVENWNKLMLGKNYEIMKEDGEIIGQQYITPVGRIDILAKNKNEKEWLVIELKKGKSSDQVIGQTLRYISWIKENEASAEENVKGLIITKDHDEKLKYSLKATQNIELMNYSVNFHLNKSE